MSSAHRVTAMDELESRQFSDEPGCARFDLRAASSGPDLSQASTLRRPPLKLRAGFLERAEPKEPCLNGIRTAIPDSNLHSAKFFSRALASAASGGMLVGE